MISLSNNAFCPIDSARCFAYIDYHEPEHSTTSEDRSRKHQLTGLLYLLHISQLACLIDIFIQAVRWPYLSQGTFRWGWERSNHEINIGTIPKQALHNQAFREQLNSTFYDFDFISETIAPKWSLTGLLSPLQQFLIMMKK